MLSKLPVVQPVTYDGEPVFLGSQSVESDIGVRPIQFSSPFFFDKEPDVVASDPQLAPFAELFIDHDPKIEPFPVGFYDFDKQTYMFEVTDSSRSATPGKTAFPTGIIIIIADFREDVLTDDH